MPPATHPLQAATNPTQLERLLLLLLLLLPPRQRWMQAGRPQAAAAHQRRLCPAGAQAAGGHCGLHCMPPPAHAAAPVVLRPWRQALLQLPRGRGRGRRRVRRLPHSTPPSWRGTPLCTAAPCSACSSATRNPSVCGVAESAEQKPVPEVEARKHTCMGVPNSTYASPVLRPSRRVSRTSTGSSPWVVEGRRVSGVRECPYRSGGSQSQLPRDTAQPRLGPRAAKQPSGCRGGWHRCRRGAEATQPRRRRGGPGAVGGGSAHGLVGPSRCRL